MIQKLFIFFSCSLLIGACSTSEKHKDHYTDIPNGAKIENQICFNHSLLVLDSTTYAEFVNSEFLRKFAFSYEKQLPGYQGFYLIGATNYLEFFHPESMEGENLENGEIWICLASLKANYLNKLNKKEQNFIKYDFDDYYNYLSLITIDSINPITTWEMRQKQYESWTKKKYHDSITFLPVDYNSTQESDSSSNYLMNDVIGIGLSLNPNDSLKVISYLKEIGYDSYSAINGFTRISNKHQFFELQFIEELKSPTINRYFIQLNESVEATTEIIGNSRIECDDRLAIWYL